MKTKRLKRIKVEGRSYYHVMSRISERRFYLGEHEKNVFCDMMERVALFSGIQILTYCIMDNHFHLLIEIPERIPLTISDIKERLPLIYRGNDLKRVLLEFKRWETQKNVRMVQELKQQYERRMFDLSEFMKTLKQRFSIWFNRNHGDRKGTLWEEDRFISVLIQSPFRHNGDMGNRAVLTIAAYIELNSVRAGIVDDPKDYLWCGYGAATAGVSCAQAGIGFLMGFLEDRMRVWSVASRAYRKHLFIQGNTRGAISHKNMHDVLKEDGCLSRAEMLRCRNRYFSTGLVIGSEAFVRNTRIQNRDCFRPTNHQEVYQIPDGNREGICAAKRC